MSRPSNQTIERYYFEQFRSHHEIPDGEIVFTDKPDVIVRGARILGIEIANLYITSGSISSSEQVQRERRLQVLKRAQSLHFCPGMRRIELSVDFDPEHPIQELESVARALAAIAGIVQNLPSGPVSEHYFAHVPELRFIYHDRSEYENANWRPVQSYSVPLLSLDRVRDVVAEKTKKLQAYQSCNAYWLLLVVDFMDLAQDQDLQWPMDAVLEKSPFERILLYKPQFSQVVEVPHS